MADQAPVAGLVLFIDDDTARFQQGMRRSQQIVEESSRRMERSLQGVDKAQRNVNQTMGRFDASAFRNTAREILFAENGVKRLQSSFVLLAGSVAGFSTAQMVMQLGKVADQYTTIRNKIATVVEGQKEQRAAEEAVFNMSQRTRTSFEATATMYARLSNAVPALAGDQTKLLRVIETIQKSFVVAGSTTQEAQSAAVQLAQGLASGRLQGDELKSILENNIPLARTLADALAGGNVGLLREMGSEGKLTAEAVIEAILTGTAKIDAQFARTVPRIADGWQAVDNAFMRYVGQLDKSLGTSEKMARGLMHISENFEAIGRAAGYAAAAIATVMVARRAGSLIGAPMVNVAGQAMAARRATNQQMIEQRAALEARRHAAEVDALVARDEQRKVSTSNTFSRAPAADQAEYGRAAARVDQARAKADAAHAAEQANIRERIKMEGASLGATSAVTKAQENLNNALKKRASLMVQTQGDGGMSRRTQNNAYKALFDEAAAKEQLAKADGHLRALEERNRKISATLSKMESGSPAQQRAAPMFQKQAAENAAARAAAEKEVAAAQRSVEIAQQRSERAAAVLDKERIARSRDTGQELIAAEKQVASTRSALANAQMSEESARQKQQATLDQQGLALRRARVAAEQQLSTAQRSLAGASMAIGVGAQGAINSSAKAVADADARVAAIKREEAAFATATANTAANASRFGQAIAGGTAVGMSAVRGLTAFLGGPWGVALTLATAAVGYFMYSQAEAAAAAEKHKKALEGLKGAMETLNKTPGIDPDALLKLKSELPGVIAGVTTDLKNLAAGFGTGLGGIFNGVGRELSTQLNEAGVATYAFQQKLATLTPGSKEAEDALKILIAEMYRLSATASPDLSAHIAALMKYASAALFASAAAREAANAISNSATAGGAAPKQLSARELREGTVGWTPGDFAKAKDFQLQYTATQKEAIETSDKLTAKRVEEMRQSDMIVAGKEREVKIEKKFMEALAARGAAYKPEDYETLRKEATLLIDTEERLEKFRESEKKGKKAGDAAAKKELNFVERIARLREQGEASFFSDLDRSVIDELKNMRASPELMAATNAALKAGTELTGKAKEIRDALQMKEAGSTYRQLIPQYGTMSQALKEAAEYQEKLNMLVNMGKLSADQAATAYADYLSKFQSFKWIDSTADAFGKFAESATMDFKNIGNAFETLMKDIQRMLIQEFVVGPIRKLVKNAITDMFTPAGGAGGILNQIMGGLGMGGAGGGAMSGGINTVGVGGLYHTGGIAGAPGSATRVMPASTWDHAPRFHSGKLGANEIPAILERGETIRTKAQERRLSSTFGALAEAAGGGGRGGNTHVEVHPPANTRTEQRRRRGADGSEHIVLMVKQIIMDDLGGNGEIAQSLQGRYGMNRVAGKGG